jgi:threonine aldolase
MHDLVDLRSDTVTRPGPEMRQAVAVAEVGDTVYNEDPTVRRLEETVARRLGKEAALYVATGTMANLLGIRLCAEPGDEVVAEATAHPILYEAGGAATFSGVIFKGVRGERGLMTPAQVEAALYAPAYYRPRQRAVLIENTHNRGGGSIYPVETLREIAALAHGRGLRVHLDGARLWNASVATGVPMQELAACADTVSVCFSKGLGAPVGSAIAGRAADIERAWHFRHMLGGSWRQAGLLAAAALYAVEHHVERLAEDHANARKLADGLSRMGLSILNRVETNMVYFALPEAERRLQILARRNVLMSEIDKDEVRCVTHLDVDAADIETALAAVGALL